MSVGGNIGEFLLKYRTIPGDNLTADGPRMQSFSAATAVTQLQLLFLNSDSEWAIADASSSSTSAGLLGFALGSSNAGLNVQVALPGSIIRDNSWSWTPGASIYISETAGEVTSSIPTAIVRRIGYALTENVIMFDPSNEYFTANKIGEIVPYVGDLPNGILLCNGNAISRTTYADLFAIIGTTFGAGDGSTTFNLPDFRSRALVGSGQGSGLTNRSIGDTGGSESVILSESELPSHSHNGTIKLSDIDGSSISATNNYLSVNTALSGVKGGEAWISDSQAPTTATMGANHLDIDTTGSDSAHQNMQPYGVTHFGIRYTV